MLILYFLREIIIICCSHRRIFLHFLLCRSMWTTAASPYEEKPTTTSARKSPSRAKPKTWTARWISHITSRAAALCTTAESQSSNATFFSPYCSWSSYTQLSCWQWKTTGHWKSTKGTGTWEFPGWSHKCWGCTSKTRLQIGEKESGIVSKSIYPWYIFHFTFFSY